MPPATRYFYPRPPRGGRLAVNKAEEGVIFYFYPRPPRGGRPNTSCSASKPINYFYPRPPRGGRLERTSNGSPALVFLSTPSAWRATSVFPSTASSASYFYPRPPRGGRPGQSTLTVFPMFYFYPRPPRGGRPFWMLSYCCCKTISIHALREEGDYSHRAERRVRGYFYPRPPRGGRR